MRKLNKCAWKLVVTCILTIYVLEYAISTLHHLLFDTFRYKSLAGEFIQRKIPLSFPHGILLSIHGIFNLPVISDILTTCCSSYTFWSFFRSFSHSYIDLHNTFVYMLCTYRCTYIYEPAQEETACNGA
jgi:hypothetical protein